MPSKLTDNLRSLVIQQWLQGAKRDKIAGDNGLSAGAVTNIVNEWRHALGFSAADGLRELAVTLKKIGISAAQCALGFRVAVTMNRLGVKEDNFESFMSDVYNRSKNVGLTPESIASHLANLIEFSKTMPVSQIPDFIQQKADEKKKLEEQIQKLKEQVKMLQEEKSTSEARCLSALSKENVTTVELKSYSDLKKELASYGISINDDYIPKFAKVVYGISQKGYDVSKVIEEFSDLESTRKEYRFYQESILELVSKYKHLEQQCTTLEEHVKSYNQKLSLYDELQAMGFGLKDLKLLRNTFNEIAEANKIPQDQAQQKFYKDIEEHYDDKLGFELQLNKLRSEIFTVNMNLNVSRMALLAQPLVAPSLQRLFSKGVGEQDIVELANLLERSQPHGDGSTNIDKLRKLVDELQRQKQGLDEQNQKMLSILAYSKPLVEFLDGSDHSFNSDEDNVKILAIIAFALYILYLRYGGVEKLADDELNKLFVPLSRAAAAAAARGGEAVSIPELKMAVVKALRVLIAKLDTKSQAKEDIFPANIKL
jgi:hypothetical protein